MNLLLIDNTIDPDSWGAGELAGSIRQAGSPTIWVRRAPHDDLPKPSTLRRFDRVILSGSRTAATETAPWISRLDELIRHCLDRSIPILGVCYGHQAIARVLGSATGTASVGRSATPEIGWTEIRRMPSTKGPDLLTGLPEKFHSFSLHHDEVYSIPGNATLLASSDRCTIQAFTLRDRPAFGVQFHPERGIEAGERTLASASRRNLPFALLRPREGHRLYSPEVAKVVFGNFLKGLR